MKKLATTLLIGTAWLASPAMAQTGAAAQDDPRADAATDEIVVTAQKRSERVLDVPITISVVDAKQLERQQVNTIQDLARTTPQVSFTAGGEGSPGGGAVVRGIGTQAFSRSASSSVGIVIDGVPTGNVNISNLFDLARVEVLAGPQGTLFGDSVSAGLINIVTNTPDPTGFSGRLNGEIVPAWENIGQQTLRGVLNVPLASNAAMRVSGYVNHTTGPTYNIRRNNDQSDTQYGGRVRLWLQPNEGITVNLIADYNRQRGEEFFNVYTAATPTSPLPARLAACGITLKPDNLLKCGDGPTYNFTENWGLSGQADFDIGDHVLTTITAYRDQKTRVEVDVDGLPAGTSVLQIQSGPETHPASFFTQEVRLTSPSAQTVEYVVGGFFSAYDSFHTQPSLVTIKFPFLPVPILSNGLQTTDTLKNDIALFGQATINFTNQFRAIVGARYNWSKIRDTFSQSGVTQGVDDWVKNLSYKLGLQYEVTPQANIYATVTRGYKGPQANDIDIRRAPVLVQPEVPMYYEVGGKAGLFNGKLIASADVYYADIKGYQAQYCPPPTPTNPVPSCAPNNVDGVTSKGFDVLLFGSPTRDLTLSSGISYAKAVYPDNYFAPDGSNLSGRQLANAPRWRAIFSGEYAPRISERAHALIGFNADYQTSIGLNQTSNAGATVPSRTVIGGRVGVRYDDQITATLFVRNLTDERVPISAGNGVAFTDPPIFETTNNWRMYGVNSGRVIGASIDFSF